MTADFEGTSSPDTFDLSDFRSPFGDDSSTGEAATPVEQQDNGTETSSAPAAGSEIKDNPAWAPVLDGLPESFQEMLKPKLKDWDRGVNQKFQEAAEFRKKVEPYQQFIESGISPQELQASHAVARQLATDPVSFFRNLESHLRSQGHLEEAERAADAAEEAEEDEEFDPSEEDEDPYEQRLSQIQQQQLEMQRRWEEQAEQERYQQEVRQEEQRIQSEFQQIEQRLGKRLSPQVRQRVVQEAINLEQQTGRETSLVEGFVSLQRFLAETQRKPAPRVLPAAGGTPSRQTKNPADMTEEERAAHMLEMLKSQ